MDSLDKTTRSIFVGNIPYEATEERLMAIFSQAGPVIGFRLVYDRESGKPKGYGFCEYNSPSVAASALRNLDNIDYGGRPLRIGPAAGEQNSAEVAMTNNTSMKPPQESPYGEKVEPHQSGLVISQAVASLPPEQLFALMHQMKQCIQNNPNESRQMLLQNPQLAYALLQAQIIMKIVDPKVAIAMLTRTNEQIPQATVEPAAAPMVPPQMFMNAQYPPNVDHLQPNTNMVPNGNMFRQPIPMQMPNQMPPPFNPFPPGQMGNNFCAPPQIFPHQSGQIDTMQPPIKTEMTNQQDNAMASEMMNYFGRTGENEKAALIMQVLSLSDEEVSKLPEEQRRSIEVLKTQLKKN